MINFYKGNISINGECDQHWQKVAFISSSSRLSRLQTNIKATENTRCTTLKQCNTGSSISQNCQNCGEILCKCAPYNGGASVSGAREIDHFGAPFPSTPPLPISLHPLTLLRSRPPYSQLGGLRERCKLSQWGVGRSPSRQQFWCILRT